MRVYSVTLVAIGLLGDCKPLIPLPTVMPPAGTPVMLPPTIPLLMLPPTMTLGLGLTALCAATLVTVGAATFVAGALVGGEE